MNAADLPKLKPRRLSNAFGVGIMDIDHSRRLDAATIASIRALWNEYGIVLLRNQEITPRQLIEYSRRFGELDLHETLTPFRNPDPAELFVLSTTPVTSHP